MDIPLKVIYIGGVDFRGRSGFSIDAWRFVTTVKICNLAWLTKLGVNFLTIRAMLLINKSTSSSRFRSMSFEYISMRSFDLSCKFASSDDFADIDLSVVGAAFDRLGFDRFAGILKSIESEDATSLVSMSTVPLCDSESLSF